MKRIIIICIGLLAAITAMAQQGLNINSLFNEKLITDDWVTQELNGKTEIIALCFILAFMGIALGIVALVLQKKEMMLQIIYLCTGFFCTGCFCRTGT